MAQLIYAPSIPVIQVANRVFTDLSNLITLVAYGNAGAATGISTFRRPGASAGYQVTTGKTLQILAGKIVTGTYVAGTAVALGYGDNDVGLAGNTTPTNAVARNQDFFQVPAIGTIYEDLFQNFNVPASKYVYMTQNAALVQTKIFLLGYEV